MVLKGRWKDFPVFTLSLEERATCPRSGVHWRSCMDNKTHSSDRVQAGPDLEWRLEREVANLDVDYLDGFVVRLHVLGDFYSTTYVDLWRKLLARHQSLNVYGYSARYDVKMDPIAAAFAKARRRCWMAMLRNAF